MKQDEEWLKLMRGIYARGNVLIHKFKMCTDAVNVNSRANVLCVW